MSRYKVVSLVVIFVIFLVMFSLLAELIYNKTQPQKENVVESTTNKPKLLNSFQEPYLSDGFDWSLPSNTQPEAYSGLIEENQSSLKLIKNRFIALRWDEINPQFGVYDFSKFDQWLKEMGSQKALIRLEVNSACEAPKWVLEKLRVSKNKSLIFWDKSYLRALEPLVQIFAKRYASNPQIIGLHLGIGDGEYRDDCDFDHKDGWGEFWMTAEELTEAQTQFDLTPTLFEKRTLEIINSYRSAFKQYSSKLVFTNFAYYSYGTEDAAAYNEALLRISKYSLEKGLGNRDGEIEAWLRYLDKIYGQKITSLEDGTCQLRMDEDYAELVKKRYWGTENEFYGNKDYVIDAEGPYRNQPYRFLISSLRALQMRRNFFSFNGDDFMVMDDPVYKTQDFLQYLTKVMGKQKNNTPDIFILLGERYVSADRVKDHSEELCVKNKPMVAIRSFGRWLSETSISRPAIKIFMPKSENHWGQDFYLPEGIDYEFSARLGNKFIFDINDELTKQRCKDSCFAEVKMVFKDINRTKIFVHLAEGVTKSMQTLGDHKIKTVSFMLKSKFNNGLRDKKDFIVQSSGVDLPVLMVRMNLLD